MKKIYVVIFKHGVSNPKVVYSNDNYPKLDLPELGNFENRVIIIPNDYYFECYTDSTDIKTALDKNMILQYMISAELRGPGIFSYDDIQRSVWLQELKFKIDI